MILESYTLKRFELIAGLGTSQSQNTLGRRRSLEVVAPLTPIFGKQKINDGMDGWMDTFDPKHIVLFKIYFFSVTT